MKQKTKPLFMVNIFFIITLVLITLWYVSERIWQIQNNFVPIGFYNRYGFFVGGIGAVVFAYLGTLIYIKYFSK